MTELLANYVPTWAGSMLAWAAVIDLATYAGLGLIALARWRRGR